MNKLFLWTISLLLFTSCQSYDSGRALSVLGTTTAGALAWKLTGRACGLDSSGWSWGLCRR